MVSQAKMISNKTVLTKTSRNILRLLSLPLLVFLVLPLLVLLLRASPLSIISNLQQSQIQQAISLSLFTTLSSTLIIVVFGIPLSFALSQDAFKRRRLIDTVIDLPLVLPPAVAGVALLITFGRGGLIGSYLATLGIQIAFTPLAVIMAQVFVSAPFFIKSAVSGFSTIDLEIEQAAGMDGANIWHLLRYIMLPLSWSALVGGAAMSWARALGEFGATIIFAGNLPGITQTMPLAIYLGFEIDLEIALTLSVILVIISFLVLILVKGLLRRDWP